MHVTLSLILMVFAFVLFALGAIPRVQPTFSLISAGLACWSLAELLGGVSLN